MDLDRISDRTHRRALFSDHAGVLIDLAPEGGELAVRTKESVGRDDGMPWTRADHDPLFDAVAPGGGAGRAYR
jgi:hypothetical protein